MKHVFEQVDGILTRYPQKEAALLPTLHLIQQLEGYLSQESIAAVSTHLNVPLVRIEQVISFYSLFRRKPVGRYLVQLCTNISCSLLGADRLLDRLEALLGIKVGQTTPDGLFTLETVECLGSCGTAPVVQINDVYYENLDEDRLQAIITSLREKMKP
ncbi:NAD(P)H-dependent oxidoreductase subunit E [bacterium]|nr:NAD(P)H-dependent oxidoreductase subunit E [bacterium]